MALFSIDAIPELAQVSSWSVVLRLLLAVLLGGLLGLERESRGRNAGFRTHIIVCLGSALAMLTNQFIYQTLGTSDPTRIGAQVISGIGFLGAGTILVASNRQIRGLTTAAGLWASAALGLAIGVGFYSAALISCLLLLAAMRLLHLIDDRFEKQARSVALYLHLRDADVLSACIRHWRNQELRVSDLHALQTSGRDCGLALTLVLNSRKPIDATELLNTASAIDGVQYAETI